MISPNSKVTLHFSIKLADGSAVDTTKMTGKPATVVIGDGTLSAGFEKALLGLNAGDKKQIILPPEEAAGMPNPNNIYTLTRKQFPDDMQLEEGLIVSFAQPDGQEIPGIIRKIENEQITVDFNHPLAGQILTFDVEILAVE